MQGPILFTLFVVVGLAVVWTLFLRNTRARWELAVMLAGTVGLLVLVILMFVQPRAAVPQTFASTIPVSTPSEVATSSGQEAAPTTTEAVPAATVIATPSPEPPTPAVTASATVSMPSLTATGTPTARSTSTAVTTAPTPGASITATRTSGPTPRATGTTGITATVGAAGGNIRSAPEVGDNIIGFVDPGDEVVVVGALGEWYLVRLGSRTAGRARIESGEGWIVSSLVEDLSGVPPQITAGP